MFGKKKQQTDPVAIAQAQRAREEQEVQAAFQKGITALRDFVSVAAQERFEEEFVQRIYGTPPADAVLVYEPAGK